MSRSTFRQEADPRRARVCAISARATTVIGMCASTLLATLLTACSTAMPPSASSPPASPPAVSTQPAAIAAAATSDDPLAPLQRGLRLNRLKAGEALPGWSLAERMAHHKVPGVAIAVLRNGEVVAARGYGLREAGTTDAVDADTLFSVGSVSKIATAATALRFVADGRLDLDRDINTYLKSWQLAPQPGIADARVSLRMLLSHTAGLDVHGFPDFQPGEAMPTLLQTLDGTPPAKVGPVRLIHEPGARYDYSGGGTMIGQLLLQELGGADFETVARREVFDPLQMARSTFANPLPAQRGNIAKAHDKDGARVALPRGWESFPEQAASGLWTSANELGRFVGVLLRSYQGRADFLPRPLAQQMMTEVSPSMHGLGPRLEGTGIARVFHHGGDNDSYHAWIEGYLETGDGLVILTNGDGGVPLRSEIRAAFSDAIGLGINSALRVVDIDLGAPVYADYAGRYELDTTVPADIRRGLIDSFDYPGFELVHGDGKLTLVLPGDDDSKQPKRYTAQALATDRFVGDGFTPFEFRLHRDARGQVRGASVERTGDTAYSRRSAQ
ncbi:serine hydrolase domain-containing protein [Tahibacter sp.]|uniref:serine hydrolase domain-containing protein n=1 Tax=Tahibacter sp. TaxID=2056211 RepID=UPI0028C43AFC|nr:serine hydrolase domain-containing protein [Tahibacter sp.]